MSARDSWPVHQPIAPDAPIPGRHWYGACDDLHARVAPSGICEGCGEIACSTCGCGFYGPAGRGCQCSPEQVVANAAASALEMLRRTPSGKPEMAAAYAALARGADANAVLAKMRGAQS